MASGNKNSPAKFVRKPKKSGGNHQGEESPRDSTDVMEESLADEIDNIVPTRGYRMLPMVGLGGSAGGITALQKFFEVMPADSGLAFVVILHLSPEHESILAELLQRTTSMPVRQAEDGMKVAPNSVYVIPPGKLLTSVDGHLRLTPIGHERGRSAAVDLFLRSLADTHGAHSSAIIFSGADADGAVGIKRIKERGGLTIAQDPGEAEHPGMPRAAIATGMVDWVLPMSKMPGRLQRYLETERRLKLPPEDGPPPTAPKTELGEEENALREVLAYLRTRTGRDFSYYKRATIVRRIGRRMQVAEVEDMGFYLSHLRNQPGEAAALLADLLISVTNFFRDRECFQALEAGIPDLFKGKGPNDSVRVWVPACATGEEAYSVAMLLVEYARRLEAPPSIQIFATDLDEAAIRAGRDGVYPQSITADVSDERLKRFFVSEHRGFRVRREIREQVLFAVHDLLKDSPFSHLDLISCRNLLIYLNREAQHRAIDIFNFALRPGGRLFLGASESVDEGDSFFAVIDKKHRIYAPLPTARTGLPFPSGPGTLARALEVQERAKDGIAVAKLAAAGGGIPLALRRMRPGEDSPFSWSELHLKVLDRIAPPSLIVNEHHEILHLSETAGHFLKFSGGEPSTNLLRTIHPALRLELRAALFRASQGRAPAASPAVAVELEDGRCLVKIRVLPERNGEIFLVLFDAGEHGAGEPKAEPLTASDESAVQHLERELEQVKSCLRDTVEQYESGTEELKASNEELQAMNEELRSATEELETSREELQSINEELTTVNAELKYKVDELALANSDLQNLMGATAIATVFLNRELRVMRYTPPAGPLFRLTPGDIGRPLTDLQHRLQYPELSADAQSVLARLVPVDRETRDDDGNIFLSRLVPYRAAGDRIAGVVLTCVDVTGRIRAEVALGESEMRFRLLAEASPAIIWVIDEEGNVRYVNQAYLDFFGRPAESVLGDQWITVVHPEDSGEYVAEVMAAVREQRPLRTRARVQRHDGQWRLIESHAIPHFREAGMYLGHVGQSHDITDIVAAIAEAEKARREAEAAARAKDDFFAVLSHELRTPLSPVLMCAGDLEMDESLPPEVREQLAMMRRNVEIEARLIDDLLDLTRARRGLLRVEPQLIDVHDVLRCAGEMVRSDMQAKRIEFQLRLNAAQSSVMGDAIRLQQVFCNLLKNGCKFTDPGGRVTVATRNPFPGRLAIDVADTGIGIDPPLIEIIFQPFDQGSVQRGRRSGGLGLGLTIARAIVDLHGGELRAASDGAGRGSTFTVELATAESPDRELETAGRNDSPVLHPLRLLVVEDHRHTLSALVRLLEGEGHQVFAATGVKDALELAAREPSDLLLSDVGLPDGTGYDLMREIKKRYGWAGIALSGYGMPADVRQSSEAGFGAHLVKPVNITMIRGAIHKIGLGSKKS